jgi:Fur family transcriptional regulator, zinc uptake regulator
MNNNDIVFEIIKRSKKHLTAYEILDKFQKYKKIQPMAVYRSLKKLIEKDKIHKSNQNKTYVLCNHTHVNHNSSIAICKDCGDTEELKSELFEAIFKKNPIKKYDLSKFQLEVSTTCRRCN